MVSSLFIHLLCAMPDSITSHAYLFCVVYGVLDQFKCLSVFHVTLVSPLRYFWDGDMKQVCYLYGYCSLFFVDMFFLVFGYNSFILFSQSSLGHRYSWMFLCVFLKPFFQHAADKGIEFSFWKKSQNCISFHYFLLSNVCLYRQDKTYNKFVNYFSNHFIWVNKTV